MHVNLSVFRQSPVTHIVYVFNSILVMHWGNFKTAALPASDSARLWSRECYVSLTCHSTLENPRPNSSSWRDNDRYADSVLSIKRPEC